MPSQPSSANCAQFSGSQPRLGRGDLAAILERVLVANEALGGVLQLLLFVGKGQIHFFLRNSCLVPGVYSPSTIFDTMFFWISLLPP